MAPVEPPAAIPQSYPGSRLAPPHASQPTRPTGFGTTASARNRRSHTSSKVGVGYGRFVSRNEYSTRRRGWHFPHVGPLRPVHNTRRNRAVRTEFRNRYPQDKIRIVRPATRRHQRANAGNRAAVMGAEAITRAQFHPASSARKPLPARQEQKPRQVRSNPPSSAAPSARLTIFGAAKA